MRPDRWESMYAEERQQEMARRIAAEGRLSVAALAREFEVTTETVRRDLSALERGHLVRRVHGGAVPASSLRIVEAELSERDEAATAEKERIAKVAVDLLPPAGAMVILDAGSTTSRLVSKLPHDHPLVVVTHAVPLAARLAAYPNVELHLLPGRVRSTTQAAVGLDTIGALEGLRADVAFVGTNGLTVEHGLSTPDRDEASVKRAMVRCARRVVVLADASKVGHESPVRFASLSEVDVIVTDSGTSREARRRLSEAGPEVIVA